MSTYIYRNSTIENLFANKDIYYSDYDSVLRNIPTDISIFVWFYQVPIKLNSASLSKEISSYLDKFRLVFEQIPTDKSIFVFTLSTILTFKYSTDDFLVKLSVDRYNAEIISLSKKYSNIKIIDIDEFFRDFDRKSLIDWKYYFISQMEINPKLALNFRNWYSRYIEEIDLKRKKCLVLDLDNTVWGGIIGEDGINGIKIGGSYPGNAFLYFQEALIELSKNGVLLTICSKNNEQDVLLALQNNPFILLKQHHISAYRINWENKVHNIKEIAEELNIGLESLVFIDDNPSERHLVKQFLPMVEVPEFPLEPYDLPEFVRFLICNYFRIYSITEEDQQKTLQYKVNAIRSKEQKKFINIEEFISSLNLIIIIEKANVYNLPRIAQLTQKTNQFNLTTKRYTDVDLIGKIDKGWLVFCISVEDKFGNYGITGTIIIEELNNIAYIDTFLLSCRVLGKGIEIAFINKILSMLKIRGIEIVRAKYIPSTKNLQVENFFDKIGFQLLKNENIKEYELFLSGKIFEIKSYYKIEIK